MFQVPGLAEKRPSLLKGDRLYVSTRRSDREFEGYVHQIQQEEVWLKFSPRLGIYVYTVVAKSLLTPPPIVSFVLSRASVSGQYMCLGLVGSQRLVL